MAENDVLATDDKEVALKLAPQPLGQLELGRAAGIFHKGVDVDLIRELHGEAVLRSPKNAAEGEIEIETNVGGDVRHLFWMIQGRTSDTL